MQYRKDKYLYQRIFAEIMLFLHQQHPKGSWRVVVIFPKRSVDAGVPADYAEYLASGRLKVVYLDELSAEMLEDFPLNVLQLITSKPSSDAVRRALQRVMNTAQAKRDNLDFERLVMNMISLKLSTITYEEVKAMVDLANARFEDTRFYRDLKAMEQKAVEKAVEKATKRSDRHRQEMVAQNLAEMGLSVEQIAKATELYQFKLIIVH